MARTTVRVLSLIAAAAVAATVTACSPPASDSAAASTPAGSATSVADLGGMDALVTAAKAEGKLNVIALPPDWTNYAEVISTFESTYGITVSSAQPDASSADEITAAKQLAGQDTAPDVFDLSQSVTVANTDMFAPYKVATIGDVPDGLKDPNGKWTNDYGGYMSIGYDSATVPAPTTVADLMKPEYKGKVALNGDPTQAGAAFNGVMMASLASGGSADDVSPGVDFFSKLNKAGNFLPLDPTPATIESGQTPVVIDWDYLNAAESTKTGGLASWKVVVPKGAVVGGYYAQAINAQAPHPAAARLWQEFLYSDVGQNLWLKGGARPVRADAMITSGTIDKGLLAKLPAVSGTPVFLTPAQTDAAAATLNSTWAKAIA
ncbi:ABC transporter substrate-binding protein [Rhodococcus antarcticus]|uniref:ABC transporter substrate-binding protein n=1 Tax=Rhodococcus antarcticus TaxID=2987751 RepID=A0ABY6P4Z5_9NOCA|nr:ABC transporter substrate-binding protein [Rhodococcus antarcticus]UZJ26233.1 ABC transporter substrate-binding protein [Rhodococcus antarcticus]